MSNFLRESSVAIISFKLTESEMREKGCELVSQLNELDSLKEEKKATARLLKDKEEFLQSRIKHLKEVVNTGVEALEQPCDKVYDFENKTIHWETSTGAKHNSRPMRDDELGKSIRMAEEDSHEQAAMDVM